MGYRFIDFQCVDFGGVEEILEADWNQQSVTTHNVFQKCNSHRTHDQCCAVIAFGFYSVYEFFRLEKGRILYGLDNNTKLYSLQISGSELF